MADATPWKLGAHFVLRTPLLSVRELTAWSAHLQASATLEGEDLETALAADRRTLRARLVEVVQRPEIREALFVASPDLEQVLTEWLESPDGEKAEKIERSVIKYYTRMASRPTPFGLFAGCSMGTFGGRSALVLDDARPCDRVTRLDMGYVCALCEALKDKPLRAELVYHPNSSAHLLGGRWRYAEGKMGPYQARSYHLIAVDNSDYLEKTMTRAASGATIADLVDLLTREDPEIGTDDARSFVEELIDTEMLVSELTPAVTEPDAVPALIVRLRGYPGGAGIAETLSRAQTALERIDAAPRGVDTSAYRAVAEALAPLPSEVNLGRLFQVDFARRTREATLHADVGAALIDGVELLRKVGVSMTPLGLESFAQAFEKRYEAQEVPLLEALDEDFGVGFSGTGAAEAPLLDGIMVPLEQPTSGAEFGMRDGVLLRLLLEGARSGATEVALGKDDIAHLAPRDPMRTPDAFALKAALLASSPAELRAGSFRILLEYIGGPSGARWLGRFCHLDPALREIVEAHISEEEALRPDAIFAEVVHLPQGRLGNVLLRPRLRSYEIPFLCKSAFPPERQIPVGDLFVSVRGGGRIVLRSKRLEREVIPRMTNMHAFGNPMNLPVYRFLTMLQEQQQDANVGFSWGSLGVAAFLPRVVAGRYVLSRATWNITGSEIEPIVKSSGAARYRAMQGLRATRQLPRWITLAEGDNVLPFDLENVLAVDVLASLFRGKPAVRIEELLPAPEAGCVEGPDGPYRHELVALMTRTSTLQPALPVPMPSRPKASSVKRSFLPGSEWLYAKLYTGSVTADQVLRDVVAPVVEEATASGAADRWFFLRYADPDSHLRVRFHGPPERIAREVLPSLERHVSGPLGTGLVARFELATYVRELERYGACAIDLAEELFCADSRAVLGILHGLPGTAPDVRWRLALLGVDRLFSDLGFGPEARPQLLANCRATGRAFHRITDAHDPMFGARFRKERREIEALLAGALPPDHPLAFGVAHLNDRSRALAPIALGLRAHEQAGTLGVAMGDVATSYAHMHVNRLLHARAPLQELVIYDFLLRVNESSLARARKRTGQNRKLDG